MPLDYVQNYALACYGTPGQPDLVIFVGEPFPRAAYIHEDVSGTVRRFKMRAAPLDIGGIEVWQADYVPPGEQKTPEEQQTEGGSGATGAQGPQGPAGPVGPQGPQGDDGVAPTHRGEYDPGTTYYLQDIVTMSGVSYISKGEGIQNRNPPTHPSEWGLLAGPGPPGVAGPPGPEGPEGPEGGPGPTGSPLPVRTVRRITTAAMPSGAGESGNVTLAEGYRVLRVVTDRAARVRLYTTAAKRDADLGRAVTADPTGDHGCVVEVVTADGLLGLDLSPVPQGYSMESSPSSAIPYRVDNRGAPGAVVVDLTWQVQEVS